MKSGRVKSIFWGILLIVTAVFVVMSYLGYVDGGSPVKIGFTVIFAGLIITSIIDLNFIGVFFPAAFICMMFDDLWGIEKLTPWPILGIALLLTIGFSLIFKKRNKTFHHESQKGYNDNIVEDYVDEDDAVINCVAKFNGITKYVHSKNLKVVNAQSKFGDIELYLDNARLAPEGAVINLDVDFAGMEIFVPHGWLVKIQASAAFGSIQERSRTVVADGAPVLYINGKVNFGGVEIIYV